MLPQSAPQSSPRNGGTLCPLDLSASPSVQRFSIMALPAADVGRKDCSSGLRLSPCASASVREAKKSSRSAVAAKKSPVVHEATRGDRANRGRGRPDFSSAAGSSRAAKRAFPPLGASSRYKAPLSPQSISPLPIHQSLQPIISLPSPPPALLTTLGTSPCFDPTRSLSARSLPKCSHPSQTLTS